MEIRWLRSFLMLADVLHYGRAAAVLHLSQSALSVQIRNLEAALGVNLLERDRRSVCLRRAGEIFREDIGKILRDLEAAQRRAKCGATGESGTIRIAFVSTAALGIVPRVVRYYKRHLPNVELTLRCLSRPEAAARLQNSALH